MQLTLAGVLYSYLSLKNGSIVSKFRLAKVSPDHDSKSI